MVLPPPPPPRRAASACASCSCFSDPLEAGETPGETAAGLWRATKTRAGGSSLGSALALPSALRLALEARSSYRLARETGNGREPLTVMVSPEFVRDL